VRTPSELLQGTVDVLILRALAWMPMHGYAISRWIKDRSRDVLAIEGAALYQALHRLERQQLILAEWGISENNRKAKYYALSALGRARLQSEAETWRTYATAVARVLRPAAS
jgi:transcriptional regulator